MNTPPKQNATGTVPDPGAIETTKPGRFATRVFSYFAKGRLDSPTIWDKSMPRLACLLRQRAETPEELLLAHVLLRVCQGAPPELLAKLPTLETVRAILEQNPAECPDVLIVAAESGAAIDVARELVAKEQAQFWPSAPAQPKGPREV